MNTRDNSMQSIIKGVRDVLRQEGITGMESVNHCIVFLLARMLTAELCETLEIPPEYSFESLWLNKIQRVLKEEEVYAKFYRNQGKNHLLYYIVNKVGFKNIKFKVRSASNLYSILEKISELDIDRLSLKHDLIGTIYELHLQDGTSTSMKELGQYYTNRSVIKYMIEMCNPQLVECSIESVLDPTMGTGGFLSMYIKHYKENFNLVNWEENKCLIHGYDLDENVLNMALVNLLLETGEKFETILHQDTLYKGLKGKEKFDIILANEPMGLKNIKYDECCEDIKELNIKGNKGECLFLQLCMQKLNEAGRCAIIVPDGLLFNDSSLYIKTRKHLVSKFKLEKIISLNDKFFLNTGVKTSIIFFCNRDETSDVVFSQLKLVNEEVVEEEIKTVSLKDIEACNYSLFINKYISSEREYIEGMRYERLEDICKFLPKSKRPASFGKIEGEFLFFKSSFNVARCELPDYNEEHVIIGDGGTANIHIANNFSCSDHNHLLQSKNPDVLNKYIYHYLRINIELLEQGFKGSTIKNLSKKYLHNLELPIPSLDIQKKIIKELDEQDENIIKAQEEMVAKVTRAENTKRSILGASYEQVDFT